VGGTGRYPYNEGHHLIVATELFVYGDESGIDQTHGYVVIAGYIASPPHWDSFNAAWRKVVDEADDPGVREFHSKQFFSRHEARKAGTKNPFRNWTDAKATKFLSDLVAVCRDHPRLTPIAAPMRLADWFSLTHGEQRYLTGGLWDKQRKRFRSAGMPSRTYVLPFFNMVAQALDAARPEDCKVHFVMDEQKVIKHGIVDLYSRARSHEQIPSALRGKFGDLTPGLSHEHPGIQAADLWAYALNGWYQHRQRLRTERVWALVQLTDRHRRAGVGVIGREGLHRLLANDLSPEDRRLIQAIKSPKEIQEAKRRH